MVDVRFIGRIFKAEPKTSASGKQYCYVTLTDSSKDKETDAYVNHYYHVSLWKGSELYASLTEQLQDGRILTVDNAKGGATPMVFICSVSAGKNFKTGEPELQFGTVKSFEIYVDPAKKSSNVQPNYEAAKVKAVATSAESEEDYETNPPW